MWCRVDVDATKTSQPSDVSCAPSTQSCSGHVSSLIETLQPPPPSPSATHTSSRSLIDALHAQTSAARSQPTLTGAVLGGVDLSLAAVVLGASNTTLPSSSRSPATTPAGTVHRQPEMRIHVTTESPERSVVTSANHGQATGARPVSSIGRRSVGVPHGSVRAFQQHQQQLHSGRPGDHQHSTLLVVPSSYRSASSSPSLTVNTRGGSVSTSPSSTSPSPSPEPVSRNSAASCVTTRSLSTHRPLGVTRSPPAVTDEQSKPSRTCVQRHCDQRQLTGRQATRTDELHEQKTFV